MSEICAIIQILDLPIVVFSGSFYTCQDSQARSSTWIVRGSGPTAYDYLAPKEKKLPRAAEVMRLRRVQEMDWGPLFVFDNALESDDIKTILTLQNAGKIDEKGTATGVGIPRPHISGSR